MVENEQVNGKTSVEITAVDINRCTVSSISTAADVKMIDGVIESLHVNRHLSRIQAN